ncbi:MAG: DNA repair protein RadC [Acidobacteriota bacterium]
MKDAVDTSGHRDRLRKRFLSCGAGAFSDHELIELLLTYAIPRRDVKPLAKRLLAECGSMSGVLGAPDEVLLQVPGLGPSALVLLRLASALRSEASRPERRCTRLRIASAEDAASYLGQFLVEDREEQVHLLFLDAKNGVLAHEVIAGGTPDEAMLRPRKILERALAVRASAVLIAHNHPSGDPAPSGADEALTAAVACALTAAGLRFLDHIVLGSSCYTSLRTMKPELFAGRR